MSVILSGICVLLASRLTWLNPDTSMPSPVQYPFMSIVHSVGLQYRSKSSVGVKIMHAYTKCLMSKRSLVVPTAHGC